MKIPKYLTSLTQEIARPSQVDMFAQLAEHHTISSNADGPRDAA